MRSWTAKRQRRYNDDRVVVLVGTMFQYGQWGTQANDGLPALRSPATGQSPRRRRTARRRVDAVQQHFVVGPVSGDPIAAVAMKRASVRRYK